MKLFQKIKWNALAKRNADYYIYSDITEKNEERYKQSGKDDVNEHIIDDELLKNSINFSTASILEIGCGNGRMAEFIADNFKNVFSVDISPEMIRQAEERLKNKKNITFLVNDGESFEIDNNTIDLVFSWIVFQHFPTKKMILNNLKGVHRVLKQGGIAKIQFRGKPAFGGLLRIFKWYYGAYCSEQEIRAMAQQLNFDILSVSGVGKKEMWFYFKKKL